MITIVPAIDIINKQLVRLSQGQFTEKVSYGISPLEMAKTIEDNGIKHLHLVDLDGAKQGEIQNLDILKQITQNTQLQVDFGGGINSVSTVKQVLQAGAKAVNIGSVAIKDNALFVSILKEFNSDAVILSADVKDTTLMINGWQTNTGIDIFAFMEQQIVNGLTKTAVTAIHADGMLAGPDFKLYEQLRKQFPKLYIVASGGVSDISDVDKLNDMGIDAVIIGKALYENRISFQQLNKFNAPC